MATTLFIPPTNPETGVSGGNIKPITDGKEVILNQSQETGGFWGGLDDLGSKITGGLGSLVDAFAEKETKKVSGGAEKTVDTTGDINDQVGAKPSQETPEPFIKKYQTPLMVGGAVVGGLLLILAFKK